MSRCGVNVQCQTLPNTLFSLFKKAKTIEQENLLVDVEFYNRFTNKSNGVACLTPNGGGGGNNGGGGGDNRVGSSRNNIIGGGLAGGKIIIARDAKENKHSHEKNKEDTKPPARNSTASNQQYVQASGHSVALGPSMASTVVKQEREEDWYYQYGQGQDGEASDETTGSLTNGDIDNMLSRSRPTSSNKQSSSIKQADVDLEWERIREAKQELLVMMQSQNSQSLKAEKRTFSPVGLARGNQRSGNRHHGETNEGHRTSRRGYRSRS